MIQHPFSRTELLVGADGIEKLKNAKVMVFGVGGVGSFAVEALTRAGVGTLILVDDDTVCITNLNRQIHATHNTVNKNKVDVIKERILSINKNCNVITHQIFVTPENLKELIPDDVDYVIDAIDTVTAKIALAEYCYEKGINLIASMGTGNKLDPTQFKVADIYDTRVCPLAKVMRYELKKRGVKKLKVVYSEEKPMKPSGEKIVPLEAEDTSKDSTKLVKTKRQVPGSVSFVPPVAGMILGGEVIKSILDIN